MTSPPAAPGADIIEVVDVCRSFTVRRRRTALRRERVQVHAVAGLAFTIGAGELVGCIGPNGAGKSTTVKMLTGILVPSSGRLRITGLDPAVRRLELARRMGVVFGQRTTLWWDLPLRDSLDLLARLYRMDPQRHRRNQDELTEVLGLGPLLDIPVRQLSLGQRVRADLAAALIHEPEILYLDEPTIGLDLTSKSVVREVLKDVNRTRGTTILLTTHDLVDIEELCERVLVIDRGRLIHDGGLQSLQARAGLRRHVVAELARAPIAAEIGPFRIGRVDGSRVSIDIPDGVSSGSVVSELCRTHEVLEVAVREPEIEDVVRIIYDQAAPDAAQGGPVYVGDDDGCGTGSDAAPEQGLSSPRTAAGIQTIVGQERG